MRIPGLLASGRCVLRRQGGRYERDTWTGCNLTDCERRADGDHLPSHGMLRSVGEGIRCTTDLVVCRSCYKPVEYELGDVLDEKELVLMSD